MVLDWLGPFMAWMERQGHHAKSRDDYNLTGRYPQINGQEMLRYIRTFNMSRHFAKLPFLPGAEEGLKRLADEFGHNLVAVTCAGKDPDTVLMRKAALYGLPFSDVHVLGLTDGKNDIFAQYDPGSVIVEDSPNHIVQGQAFGHVGVIYDQPYNRKFFSQHRAYNWGAVVVMTNRLLGGAS